MLYTPLLRRTLALHLTLPSIRTLSLTTTAAMSSTVPPSQFVLDRSIFNQTLYNSLRSYWFQDVPANTVAPTAAMTNRWFGVNQTDAEKEAFDRECYDNFGHALEALGPEKLALPEWEGYGKELERAEEVSAPLLKEVREAGEGKEKAETLLSLVLLLDQIPRNIFREGEGLRRVFTHYDRLSWTLLRSCLRMEPTPVEDGMYAGKVAWQMWFLIPLMHSEDLGSHRLYLEIYRRWMKAAEDAGLEAEGMEALQRTEGFEMMHLRLVERFGRYPHRNAALGRESTREEEEFLREGETFGVKQGSKEEKDEL